jgi:hypothetical protein
VLRQLVAWIVDLANWLNPAIDRMIAWEQTTHTMWNTLQGFANIVAGAWAYLTQVAEQAWRIFVVLYDALKPFLPILAAIGGFLAGAFLEGLKTLAGWLEAMPADLRLILTMTGLFIGALWLLDAAITANPVGALVVGIILLVGLLTMAYQKVGWFRSAVDWLAQAAKDAAVWLSNAYDWIKRAFGDAIDYVVPKVMWLIDKIKWIIDKAGTVTGFAGKVLKYSPYGVATQGVLKGAHALGLQSGGSVTRGGAFRVGEAGPETVTLPAGAAVTPHGGGDVYVHATLVMPDGEVLARQTLRAARRKQSVS